MKVPRYTYIPFVLFTLLCGSLFSVHAQTKVSGIIIDADNKAVPHATVSIASRQVITSDAGAFSFASITENPFVLQVNAIGYQSYTDTIVVRSSEPIQLTIKLQKQSEQISEVLVEGKTETQRVKEQAIRAIVVDTKAAAEQPVTLAELMNRSPGIRIRQSGGLGNQVDVSINGFQGNSVQYFRDGIPLEYLGGGYGINNVPINQLERVEVYKGVVPVALGADALGGAVNLVSNKGFQSSLQASYEVASFNTHLANLSWFQNLKKNYFVGIDAFVNYSDNDYKVDVEVPNEDANLVPARVSLFHNAYKHYFAEAYVGLKNKVWTDELRFALALYDIERQSQHPALMTNPYGAIVLNNTGLIPSIRYKKSFLDNRLSLDQFVSYSHVNRNRTDTIRGTFDWYGQFTPGTSVGESPNPSQSDIDFDALFSRTALSWALSANHQLTANYTWSTSTRVGSDPLGFRFAGTDVDILSKEAQYQKSILGLSWESKWFANKLTNQFFVKHFSYSSTGINAFLSNDTDLNKFKKVSDQNFGFGNAIKYQLNPKSFFRASAELTNRLPRENELFGNNDTQAPNFNLKPERSFNVNLGYRYSEAKYSAEIGVFYRKTKGMIMLTPIQMPFSQYKNLDSIRGYGFDVDLSYRPIRNLEISANATWQDIRMIDIGVPLYKWIEGTRVTNTPYFFSNIGIKGRFSNIVAKDDLLQPYIHYNFIREFYLVHIPRDKEDQTFLGIFGSSDINTKDLVPDQSLLHIGFNYSLPSSRWSFGAEVKNLTDTKLYDYYKVQRPGRSIHFKINYFIKSIKSQ